MPQREALALVAGFTSLALRDDARAGGAVNGLHPLTLLHVCGVVVGVVSGALAMLVPKGASLHRLAGTFFFVSMLLGTGAGAWLAAFVHPNHANVIGSSLTFYLVATAWYAARRAERIVTAFDWTALLVVLAVATTAIRWGLRDSETFFLVFGAIALLFAVGDVRLIARGGVAGGQRIARHLWRMCVALLFALASAYPGQAKLLPPGSKSSLFFAPHILLIAAMIFWRVRATRRVVASCEKA